MGQVSKAVPRAKAAAYPKYAPVPEREPTLRGRVHGLPCELKLLNESTSPPKKSESSLVGLSLKVERATRNKKSTRFKPPGAPPAGISDAAKLDDARGDAYPTDYNAQVLGAYRLPPVLRSLDSVTIDLSHSDELWEVDPFRRSKRSRLLGALALLAAAALGVVYAPYRLTESFASRTETAAQAASRTHQAVHAARPERTEANVASHAVAVSGAAEPPETFAAQESGAFGSELFTANTPALTAEMLAPKSSAPAAHAKGHTQARHKRRHPDRRVNKRKVARLSLRSAADPFERFE